MLEPRRDETEEEFVERSMNDPETVSAFPDRKLRGALCQGHYRRERQKRSRRDALEDLKALQRKQEAPRA